LLILFTLMLIFMFFLILIKYLDKQKAPIRTTVLQLASSISFLLIVFLLAYLNKISSQTISTLLGAYAGYIFGKVTNKFEWRN
jgi:hypothetical protein